MRKWLVAALVAVLAALAAPAFGQNIGGGSHTYSDWYPSAAPVTVTAANTSANHVYPSFAQTALFCNLGSNDTYVNPFGRDNTVTASSSNLLLGAGRCRSFNLNPYNSQFTWFAYYAATGSPSVYIETGVGEPPASAVAAILAGASNASVGTNNTTAPGSSTQVGVQDGSGNLQPVGPNHPVPTSALPTNVTPAAGATSTVTTGGTAVTVISGPVHGGYVVNPPNAASQGISTAENAYCDPVTTPGSTDGAANGTTTLLQSGQVYNVPPLATGTTLKCNAATNGHKLNVISY